MKNKNLLPFLAVAAGGLYLANQTGSKANATDTKTLAFTGDTFADEEALKDALVKVIKANNIELRTLLRGNDGTKGDNGEKGDTGLNGIQVQNYGGSLLQNGALELGNLDFWALQSVKVSNDYLGMDSLICQNVNINDTVVYLCSDRLYCLSGYFKKNLTDGEVLAFISNRETLVTQSLPTLFSVSESNYTYKKGYLSSNISNAYHRRVRIGVKNCYSNSLIFRIVDLGEAVPHNLPFLPLNQTVLNNTNGKVGIYNGTTVDYYF